jgi:hypothetical protein
MLVIRPTLARLPFGDAPRGAAENLLLGTIAQESGAQYLAQYPTGPALGFFQMEPATHQDILTNFIEVRPALKAAVDGLAAADPARDSQLVTNVAYATAVARCLYRRIPNPLPLANDVAGLAAYYKQFYNTPLGAATTYDFIANYSRCIGD